MSRWACTCMRTHFPRPLGTTPRPVAGFAAFILFRQSPFLAHTEGPTSGSQVRPVLAQNRARASLPQAGDGAALRADTSQTSPCSLAAGVSSVPAFYLLCVLGPWMSPGLTHN